MPRSVIAIALIAATLGISACATKQPPKLPLPERRTATLRITPGIQVASQVPLPGDFAPDTSFAPLWLQHGKEIGVVGTAEGRTVVIGFSSEGPVKGRLLAADFGPEAPHGRIVGLALSPDGKTFAAAVATATEDRTDIYLVNAATGSESDRVVSFNGDLQCLGLAWLGSSSLALAIQSIRPAPSPSHTLPKTRAAALGPGIYVIRITGGVLVKRVDVKCPLSPMSFSPKGSFAIGQGDTNALPILVDMKTGACEVFRVPRGRLRVLGWSQRGSAFVYAAASPDSRGTGAFRYDIASGQGAVVAISSSAAAYTSDGGIVALGNQSLTWRRISEQPGAPTVAEIALFAPSEPEVQINSLGIRTLPWMLAQSTIVYSKTSDTAAIEMFIPGAGGVIREIIVYSVPMRSAFLVAEGPAAGKASFSWSPDGKKLAIVDDNGTASTLTIIIPPRLPVRTAAKPSKH